MSEEQTISTLRFASEAKKIQNHAKVNEVLDNQATISRLKKENEELKRQMELQKSTNMSEMVEELREQLEAERREKENQLKLNEERIISSGKKEIREGLKKKSKNMMEFSIIGLTPPYPYDGKFLGQESVRRTPPPR